MLQFPVDRRPTVILFPCLHLEAVWEGLDKDFFLTLAAISVMTTSFIVIYMLCVIVLNGICNDFQHIGV